jgi:outer membrane receptor protein involved in Fe transport
MNSDLLKTICIFASLASFTLTYTPVHGQETQAADPSPTSVDSQKSKNDPVYIAPEPIVVIVTASRGPTVNDAPVATTVMSQQQISTTPAQSPDGILREVPSVSLPRNDSHFLHPTGQAIAIRGLGRGRTLVLADGVPLNDPFGGWIQWNKIPLVDVNRVEIVRGASSNLYGNLAMAGVVQYFTAPTDEKRFFSQFEGGNLDTYHGAFNAAGPLSDGLSGSIHGDIFRTNGYPLVLRQGPVDTPAGFESNNGGVKLTWKPNAQLSSFLSANYYSDFRDSGSRRSDNNWWFGDGASGIDYRTDGGSHWQFRLFGGGEKFSNNNVSINAARTTEIRTLHQYIPVENIGGSLVWWKAFGSQHALTFGFDNRMITAENKEHSYSSTTGVLNGKPHAKGNQELMGLFGEWSYTPIEQVTLTAGLRYDHWWNFHADSTSRTGVFTDFSDQDKGAFNPRFGVVYRVTPEFGLRTATYTGFRAPNLNELYRSFGNNPTTLGNPALGPERVYGVEAGLDWSPVRPLRFNLTGFYDKITDMIQTLTVNATTLQRFNVGAARSYGVEFDSQYRPIESLTFTASYALTMAYVTEYKEDPRLIGKWISSVPRQQGAVTVRWADPEWVDVTLRMRAEGIQFANDLNTFKLPGYVTLDFYLARELVKNTQAFVTVNNLLDKQVITGRNATVTNIGAPVTAMGGVKVRF